MATAASLHLHLNLLLSSSRRRRGLLLTRASAASNNNNDCTITTRRRFIADTAAAAAVAPLLSPLGTRAEQLSEWERVLLPIDPGVVLLDIAFVPDDPSHGFLLGTRQTLLETKDGGNTWKPRSIASAEDEDFNYRFNSVSFMGKEGWIIGKPAILLHTSDAGESWERIPLSAQLPGNMVYIKATGEKSAEMVTDEGAIYVTSNRGYNWKAAVQETVSATLNRTVSSGISGASYYTGTFNTVNRSPDGRYVAVSSRGNFYLTWEPGQPFWQPHNRAVARRIQNMGWRADGGLWLLVRGGGLFLSKGSGITEDFDEASVQSRGFGLLDVGYRSKDEAWAAGGSGVLLKTTNGGRTWVRDKAADNIAANLYSVKFLDDSKGFVLGNDGVLLRYALQQMPCALGATDRRPQCIPHTQCNRLVDHNSNSSCSKDHLIRKTGNRDISFATLSPEHNSVWKLVHFLSDIQDIDKSTCFTSGAAGTESLQFPQPIVLCWLDCPNEKNMHDQVDHSKPFSSGSPPPVSTLIQHRHKRKTKKSLTAVPPCIVLVNNSSRSVTAPVRSDSNILHEDGKPPRKSPKKKGSNKKGKHYRRATCKSLNLLSEIHCEENIDAASPVEVLTDLLVEKLSETSSSASSVVKEAQFGEHNGGNNNEYAERRTKLNLSTLGSDDMDGSGCTGSSNKTVGKIFSCKDIPYLNDGSNNTEKSKFLGSTITEHECPYIGEERNNFEKSLCSGVCSSNDTTTYSLFNKLERGNSVNSHANDEVRDSCHLIADHLSTTHAEDSNHSFGRSSCCSKDVTDSSSHTERVKCSSEACSSKTSLPVIPGKSGRKSRKTSSYGYSTATNGVVGTNKHKHSGKYSSTSVWQKVEKLNVKNTSTAGCMIDSTIQNKSLLENIKNGVKYDLTTHNQRREKCDQHSPDGIVEMEHAKENDALNSCQAFSAYKYKKQTPFLFQQTSLSSNQGTQSSMQLVYEKVSSVDTGVGRNSPAQGIGSSQYGVDKATLASCNMDLPPKATYEEACTASIQEDPLSSCPENKAISTESNSKNLCADPSPAEVQERCYVKLTSENTTQECCNLFSPTGKHSKLYSAAAHVSQKWVAVGKKNIVHFDGLETSAVDASVLTNGIPISANIDVEINVCSAPSSANNEVNELAAEISYKPNSSGHLDLRCQPSTDTGTDFNKIREAVCDAYRAQQRVDDVQVIVGRSLADFERFIYSASPVINCNTFPAGRNFCSQEWIRDGLCFHQTTDITLSRIWRWYEEPCCYGLEVKAQDFRRSKGLWNIHDQFSTYFVPYLSAVQLFGQAMKASTGRVDKEAAGSDLHTKDDQQFGSGELIFEFFESEQPFWRRQLFDKIKELISGVKPSNCQISGDPRNLELSLHDLHPASWAHQNGLVTDVLFFQSQDLSLTMTSVEDAESTEEESVWSEASQVVKERLRTLKGAAAVMSRAKVLKEEGMCRNRHPDYDFFLSRQPRR
uniref:Photosynthesis system II assembly factor Ycf48/Hcf136-like domain-containing protein n=1 Tax=Leersia perrieri TaxID=77586 RepID=A0A0D9WUE3_9ORYZ